MGAGKSGLGDVQAVRKRLMDVELQYNQFAASIKEKQSHGALVPENDYQKLYELDLERKKLAGQLEKLEGDDSPTSGATAGLSGSASSRQPPLPDKPAVPPTGTAGCCAARSARKRSPRWSAPGPASPSRG